MEYLSVHKQAERTRKYYLTRFYIQHISQLGRIGMTSHKTKKIDPLENSIYINNITKAQDKRSSYKLHNVYLH